MRAPEPGNPHVSLLTALEESPVGLWIRESEWGYPIVLICHTLGMACLVGSALAFDLRLLIARTPTRLAWFSAMSRIACVGFAINLLSGLVLFTGAAHRLIANPAFQAKLIALAFAGVSTWVLIKRVGRNERSESAADVVTRSLAAAAGLLWVAAIGAGRLIAYIR